MKDYVSIGPTPAGEDCVAVGSEDYYQRYRKECRAFINQLRRVFGDPPDGSSLRIKANPHDFGVYHEVVCYFDDDNLEATDYALRCENECPEYWDEQAKQELLA